MAEAVAHKTLVDTVRQGGAAGMRMRQAVPVTLGIAALSLAAQIEVAVPPWPVAVDLGSLAAPTVGGA